MLRIIVVLLVSLTSTNYAFSRSAPSVDEFFQINGDYSTIKWSHAVNSISELEQALNGRSMMIEADVGMGALKGNSTLFSNGQLVGPIMSHSILGSSDLSLEQFLDTTLTANSKGIKLDFKNIDALEPALILLTQRSRIQVPVWLNADIVPGPVDAPNKPVDAERFMSLVQKYVVPGAVLSVGWTTRFGPELTNPLINVKEGSYSLEQMKQMIDVLFKSNVGYDVTFPVRAGLIASQESRNNLLWLLEQVPRSTLTVWSSFYDTVDVAGLMKTLRAVGMERVFIDVPAGLNCQIKHFDEDF